MLALAFRADGRHTLGIPAIMAEQAAVAPMIGEGNRAVSALYALAAGAAGYKARKTAAVEQQHGLLAVFDALADGFHQTPRKGGLLSRFEEFLAHIDQVDARQRPFLDTLRQFEQRILFALDVVTAFEAGSG